MDKYAPFVIASYLIAGVVLAWIALSAILRARSAARLLARLEADETGES
ncbi:heme exporter protein CcmD [bacterium]|nr:heme exporter protein CcmD [bacterium]